MGGQAGTQPPLFSTSLSRSGSTVFQELVGTPFPSPALNMAQLLLILEDSYRWEMGERWSSQTPHSPRGPKSSPLTLPPLQRR